MFIFVRIVRSIYIVHAIESCYLGSRNNWPRAKYSQNVWGLLYRGNTFVLHSSSLFIDQHVEDKHDAYSHLHIGYLKLNLLMKNT